MKYSLLLLSLVLLLAGCSGGGGHTAQLTILVYMAADNGLTQYAVNDINQMEKADYDRSKINVVVQADFSDYYTYAPGRFLIKSDYDSTIDNSRVSGLREPNTGDPATLANFINWGTRAFPAKQTALIIWSHGNGWRSSAHLCADDDPDDYLDVTDGELRRALQMAGHSFDWLAFDACSMQTIEVLAEVEGYVSYVMGSEIDVPVNGFPYTDLLELTNTEQDHADLLSNYAMAYLDSYIWGGSQNPHGPAVEVAMSVADMSRYQDFYQLLQQLATNAPLVTDWSAYANARNQTLFLNDGFYSAQLNMDAYDYFSNLAENMPQSELASQLVQACQNLFVFADTYNVPSPNVGYASLWLPTNSSSYTSFLPLYQGLQFNNSGWSNFINYYLNSRGDR